LRDSLFPTQTVALNHVVALTLRIANPNTAGQLTGLWFYMPFSTAVGSSSGGLVPDRLVSNTCGGVVTATSTPSGVIIPAYVNLEGGSLDAGLSCEITVLMAGSGPGLASLPITLNSAQGGQSYALTSIKILASPPQVAARFSPQRVDVGGTSQLTITLTDQGANESATPLSSVALVDILPFGLKIAPSTIRRNTCHGTLTAPSGSRSIVLHAGNLSLNTSCTVTVSVRATKAGAFRDSTGPVTSDEAAASSAAMTNLRARSTRHHRA
jgi:uncharacterized repeat protein (TIGR01451 family)